jgi:hypothetical protein
VSFHTITLCAASQQGFGGGDVYFVIDSVRKILDTPLYRNSQFVLSQQGMQIKAETAPPHRDSYKGNLPETK